MVAKYRKQQLCVYGQEIEAYDCDIDGDDNIITGTGNRIRGSGNTIFGMQESVDGNRNVVIDDMKKKKRKKDDDYEFSDTKKAIKKHLESTPGDFGPGGLKLIPKKREEEVTDESVELLYCKVCRDKIVRVLCEPCNHLCLCISCSRKIGGVRIDPACPCCKKKIIRFREVYLM